MDKVLFLDRDGVINVDFGYVGSVHNIEFLDGLFNFLSGAVDQGYKICIVTNQSGLARGLFSLNDFLEVMDFICDRIESYTGERPIYFYCPHLPDDGCLCRKPKHKMFSDAEIFLGEVDWKNSLMVGDKITDMIAASAAGVVSLFLLDPLRKVELDLAGEYFSNPVVRISNFSQIWL